MGHADDAPEIAESAVCNATLDKKGNVEDFEGSTDTETLQDASFGDALSKKLSRFKTSGPQVSNL